MLSNHVLKFYDNFGLIFKGSEDKETNGIENWSLLTTSRLADASSRETCSECPHKPYVTSSNFIRFHIVVSESQAEKSSQSDGENRF